jgi:3-phosphoshikimate 1-carboxyvinyltransferase
MESSSRGAQRRGDPEGREAPDVPLGTVATYMDHRIAMSFLVMGLATLEPMAVDDVAMIATSFPAFRPTMERLGAQFR